MENTQKRTLKLYWRLGNEETKRISHLIPYVGDLKHGREYAWSFDGMIMDSTPFVNGLKHGKEFGFDKWGNLCSEIDWVNGLKHGQWIQWHRNGNMKFCMEYVGGEHHGLDIAWDEKGRIRRKKIWAFGEPTRKRCEAFECPKQEYFK